MFIVKNFRRHKTPKDAATYRRRGDSLYIVEAFDIGTTYGGKTEPANRFRSAGLTSSPGVVGW
jgi:hypothetical protein